MRVTFSPTIKATVKPTLLGSAYKVTQEWCPMGSSNQPRVLVLDRDSLKQKLRATIFRNCEIDVRTTDSTRDALRRCKIHSYDVVLVAGETEETSLFCNELRRAVPRQRIALLVGPLSYLREIAVKQRVSAPRPPKSAPRLTLVQPQRTQWRALIDRLLATGEYRRKPLLAGKYWSGREDLNLCSRERLSRGIPVSL